MANQIQNQPTLEEQIKQAQEKVDAAQLMVRTSSTKSEGGAMLKTEHIRGLEKAQETLVTLLRKAVHTANEELEKTPLQPKETKAAAEEKLKQAEQALKKALRHQESRNLSTMDDKEAFAPLSQALRLFHADTYDAQAALKDNNPKAQVEAQALRNEADHMVLGIALKMQSSEFKDIDEAKHAISDALNKLENMRMPLPQPAPPSTNLSATMGALNAQAVQQANTGAAMTGNTMQPGLLTASARAATVAPPLAEQTLQQPPTQDINNPITNANVSDPGTTYCGC